MRNNRKAVELMESYKDKEQASITVVTRYELTRGRRLSEEKLNDFMGSVNIIYFGDKEVDASVEIYRNLRIKGKLINELDIMIAGIASANNETLLSADGDFRAIGGDRIIVI